MKTQREGREEESKFLLSRRYVCSMGLEERLRARIDLFAERPSPSLRVFVHDIEGKGSC